MAPLTDDRTAPSGLLAGYDTDGFYDEAVDDDGELRPEYEVLFDRLRAMTHEELARRAAMSDDTMRKRGVTFTLTADPDAEDGDEDLERTLPMDVLPRVIGGAAWRDLEAGLIQRVSALNAFLEDLYVGERAAVRDGIVPWWLVTSSDGFVREAVGVPAPSGVRCLVAGLDLVRGADGQLRVLEDNLRNPSGISYVLENRDLMTRLFPSIVRAHRVRPVGNYGELLLRALRSVAPAGVADPCVVVMTPGIHNAAYFEHAFLAHQMGVELVEGNDLLVDGQRVYMRTTEGPRPVHVIYRRLDDRFLDPVGLPQRQLHRRARPAHARPGRARSRWPTRWATGWPTTRPSTPSCPTWSATTSTRSPCCPTSAPTACGTPTSGPRSSTASTSW